MAWWHMVVWELSIVGILVGGLWAARCIERNERQSRPMSRLLAPRKRSHSKAGT
jgi:FtsZ-interacting cell division protein ZipA